MAIAETHRDMYPCRTSRQCINTAFQHLLFRVPLPVLRAELVVPFAFAKGNIGQATPIPLEVVYILRVLPVCQKAMAIDLPRNYAQVTGEGVPGARGRRLGATEVIFGIGA